MDLYDAIQEIADIEGNLIQSGMADGSVVRVTAKEVGLDERCGNVFVSTDWIAIERRGQKVLNYYGGFEYVDPEYVHALTEYVFYSTEDSRVSGHIDTYFCNKDHND